MNCPKCQNDMIKTRAKNNGEEFDYCRTCKKELAEIEEEFAVAFAMEVGGFIIASTPEQSIRDAAVFGEGILKITGVEAIGLRWWDIDNIEEFKKAIKDQAANSIRSLQSQGEQKIKIPVTTTSKIADYPQNPNCKCSFCQEVRNARSKQRT